MGRAYVPARVCAVCVKSEATETTIIDGRTYHVCAEHGDGGRIVVDDGPSDACGRRSQAIEMRRTVLSAVKRSPGITMIDMADNLGICPGNGRGQRKERDALYQIVRRMVREGRIVTTGTRSSLKYWLAGDRTEP